MFKSKIRQFLNAPQIFAISSLFGCYFVFLHFLSETPSYSLSLAILFFDAAIISALRAQNIILNEIRKHRTIFGVLAFFAVLILELHGLYLFERFLFPIFGSVLQLKNIILWRQIELIAAICLIKIVLRPNRIQVIQEISWADFGLTILPAIPLANYFFSNISFFNGLEIAKYWFELLALPSIFFILVRIFFVSISSGKFLAPLVYSGFFVYYTMPSVTSKLLSPAALGVNWHLFMLAIICSIICALYAKNRKTLVTILLLIFLSYPVTWVITPAQDLHLENDASVSTNVGKLLDNKAPPKNRPNVYFLVYDSYVNEKFLNYLGLDNSKQMSYLSQRGFKIYPDNYTIAVRSIPSISRVMDMSRHPKEHLAGPNVVFRTFKRWGYRTYALASAYHFGGLSNVGPDVLFPAEITPVGASAIIHGIKSGRFDENKIFTDVGNQEWVDEKHRVIDLINESKTPSFIYAHSLTMHHMGSDRYSCIGDEISRYRVMLDKTNLEMQSDIDRITNTDSEAIVIIAGDHGPAVNSCSAHDVGNIPFDRIDGAQLADVFGSFLAIKWPDQKYLKYDKIEILQHVFNGIFSYLLEDEELLGVRTSSEIIHYSPASIIPEAGISAGLITFGPDKGKKLFKSF